MDQLSSDVAISLWRQASFSSSKALLLVPDVRSAPDTDQLHVSLFFGLVLYRNLIGISLVAVVEHRKIE